MHKIYKFQPKWVVIKFIFIQILVLGLPMQIASANSVDYTTWKAQQQQQDTRLKQQNTTTAANHYLSKPSLNSTDSANKISLNTATVDQLQQLHGIGLKKAEAIVKYRSQNGKFKNIEDIQRIKGIGPAIFSKNKARLAL